jgi:hypothetical protein
MMPNGNGGFEPMDPRMMANTDIQSPEAQAYGQSVAQPNDLVAQILYARVDFLTPEEARLLRTAISPQTMPVFLKVFPELEPLLARGLAMNGAGMQSSMAPQPGAPGVPGPGGAPPVAPPPVALGGAGPTAGPPMPASTTGGPTPTVATLPGYQPDEDENTPLRRPQSPMARMPFQR